MSDPRDAIAPPFMGGPLPEGARLVWADDLEAEIGKTVRFDFSVAAWILTGVELSPTSDVVHVFFRLAGRPDRITNRGATDLGFYRQVAVLPEVSL